MKLKPSQLSKALVACIKSKRPAFIWGSPGIGKSQIVRQVAKTLKIQIKDVRLALLDPVDLRGLPFVDKKGRSSWAQPAFLPTEGTGILFLDEFNAAPPLVQAACYQLVLDRQLGEYTLPEGWTIVCAGNYDTDGGVTSRMPTPMKNRLVHLELDVDFEEWYTWACNPANGIEPVVAAFPRFRPTLLYSPKKDAKAFPTLRSWEFVSDILKTKPEPMVELALITGCVGDAANEFITFKKMFEGLPSIDHIISNPKQAALPDGNNPSLSYAVAQALGARANKANFSAIMAYLRRMPAEYQKMAVLAATNRDGTLKLLPAFTAWAATDGDSSF